MTWFLFSLVQREISAARLWHDTHRNSPTDHFHSLFMLRTIRFTPKKQATLQIWRWRAAAATREPLSSGGKNGLASILPLLPFYQNMRCMLNDQRLIQSPVVVHSLQTVNNWAVQITAWGSFLTLFSFLMFRLRELMLDVIQEHGGAESTSEEIYLRCFPPRLCLPSSCETKIVLFIFMAVHYDVFFQKPCLS